VSSAAVASTLVFVLNLLGAGAPPHKLGSAYVLPLLLHVCLPRVLLPQCVVEQASTAAADELVHPPKQSAGCALRFVARLRQDSGSCKGCVHRGMASRRIPLQMEGPAGLGNMAG